MKAIRKATDIIMEGSLFTMCSCDFIKPKKKAWKKPVNEKSPYYHVTEFPVCNASCSKKENTVPLGVSKDFSMEVSIILDDSHGIEDPAIVWETARTKAFPFKYINHSTYVKDFCGTFKSKNVYTFVQRPNNIVLFPPCCAKQGKVDYGLSQLATWSVHKDRKSVV